jgi:molybdopterin converting factor small subunit
MIRVKLFGVLRDTVKSGEIAVPADLTIWQIMEHLKGRYGSAVGNLLFQEKDGGLVKRAPVVILIAGTSQTDLRRVIRDGEVVSIFPAIAGG